MFHGKAVKSCTQKCSRLEGKSIATAGAAGGEADESAFDEYTL